MQCLILLAATLAAAIAVPPFPGDNSHYKEGDQYIWFPDGDNIPVLADLYEEAPIESISSRRGASNEYYLYKRFNRTTTGAERLYLDDEESLSQSSFDPSKITKFLIHGWRDTQHSNLVQLVLPALLQEGDYNVIVVDWSHTSYGTYAATVSRVVSIGEYIGEFLKFLNANGAPYANIHLIGHSLGAHISGIAGRHVGAQIGRITGLDPAGPLWPSNSNKLTKKSALFVEAIHTDAGFLGYWDPLGHADFYPNGGHSQPGCWLSSCHHSRAYELYAATVTYNHLEGYECDDINAATSRVCTGEKTEFMGNTLMSKSNHGIFRMETDRIYPY